MANGMVWALGSSLAKEYFTMHMQIIGYGLLVSITIRKGLTARRSYIRKEGDLYQYVPGPIAMGEKRLSREEEQRLGHRFDRAMERANFKLVA